jgi:hypothetical protein
MKILKYGFIFVMLAPLFSGCEKVGEGYISDSIIYYKNPMGANAGDLTASSTPNTLGTSYPCSFTLLTVKDKNGNVTNDLFQTKEVTLWTKPFDMANDTTLEIINSKTMKGQMPIAQINPQSGQIYITPASVVIPDSSVYTMDVQAKNTAGTAIYKDALKVIIRGADYTVNSVIGYTYRVSPYGYSGNLKNPEYTITRTDGPANGPWTISVVCMDKNGSIWNPKKGEIIPRADRQTYEALSRYAKSVYTDTSMVYTVPFFKWPYSGYPDGIFRIKGPYCSVDGNALGELYAHFILSIYYIKPGNYTVRVKLTDVTRTPAP